MPMLVILLSKPLKYEGQKLKQMFICSDRSSLSSGSSGDNSVETMRGQNHPKSVTQPVRPSRGNYGLQERKHNLDSQSNMRSLKNLENKKLHGGVEDWRQSLKTNTNKLEGKENELVRNKEAVKNRSTQVRLTCLLMQNN